MEEIKHFYKKAKHSMREGKFYHRPWKQLLQIILLNFVWWFLCDKENRSFYGKY